MFNSKCAICVKTVRDGIECSVCKKLFHFICAQKEHGFERRGTDRETWMCSTCRSASQLASERSGESAGNPGSSKSSSGQDLLTSSPKESVLKGVDEQSHFAVLNDISARISHMQAQLTTIYSIQQDLQEVKSDIAVMKVTLNERLDNLFTRIGDIDTRVSAVECLKSDVEELKEQVKIIMEDGHKNEQWVRRSNIQINGVPQKAGENLVKTVVALANRSGFPLNPETDIDFVTRVAVRSGDEKKAKPIVLKMQSRYKKDDFLASLRKLRDCKASDVGFQDSNSRIYFNDHLSSRNKQLLVQAKLKAKEKSYAYCWVRNCTIMVRKSDKSPVIHITSSESLKKIT